MTHPGWILVPWAVFALGALLKVWQIYAALRAKRLATLSSSQQIRDRLERIWVQS